MKRRSRSGFRLLLLSALSFSGPVFADWDGVSQGTIYAVDVTGGNNYGVRVHVTGVTNMCGSGSSWAYLNEQDSNYKVYVAAIMMAKAQGSPVTVYTTRENGYCHIGYISINS